MKRNWGQYGMLLGLLGCLYCVLEVVTSDCSNEAGNCNFYNYYLRCYINNNDTQLIKFLLRDCSDNRTLFTTIYIYKNYISNEYGNLLIEFDLPTNIQRLYIYNYQDQDHIRIATFVQNYGLREISCDNYLELETNTFFTNFVNIQYIHVSYIFSTKAPSFSNLQSLTSLSTCVLSPVTYAFDDSIVSGSTNLVRLVFYDSSFNGISKGAFHGLNQLTQLNFGMNTLTFIEEGSFTDLTNIRTIYLQDNKLSSVPDNVFEGLTKLTHLDLDNNPGFPINAVMSARNVEHLEIRYNGYQTLDQFVFQQMDSLKYLYLSDPFICDCRLRWVSFLNQFGINVNSSPRCSEPFKFAQRLITNQQIYANCSQTQTYQCFNNLITCPSDLICHNTEDDYVCACPIGHVLHISGDCEDIDECDEETECQQGCVNTEGSFHCACEEGYKLASDGYDCDDMNECQTENGGCQFGCSNTVGSYQCYCANGHKMMNRTHCEEGIECELIENSCFDIQESNYVCKGGYNLTINMELACDLVSTHTTYKLTTVASSQPTLSASKSESNLAVISLALVGLLIILNLISTFGFITLCIYMRRMKNNQKNLQPRRDVAEPQVEVNPAAALQNNPGRVNEANREYHNIN